MPLSQLQGLNPLGGSSGYGMGRPPNGDGTSSNYPDDPNNPNNPNARPRRPQNTGAPSSSPGSSSPGQPTQTFAQMQAQGRARPAPPPAQSSAQPPGGQLAGQIQQSASQALQNPSAYGAPQVQQAMDTLNQGLATQATLGRRQIDETMAQRGLYDSTATGDKYGFLQAQQDQTRAQYATQLAQQAAMTYGSDRSAALQNAAGVQSQLAGQGLSQQQQNLAQQLGYANLTGQLNGQSTLGNQALGLQAQQQAQNYALGSAGLTGQFNGQSTLGAQQLGLQNQQFQQSLGLQSQLGLGQLGISQQQANTQQAGTIGNLQLGQQQLGQQQSQFGQSFGLQQLQNQQQYGLSSQQLALQQAMGYGNLGLAQQTQQQNNALANRGLDLQQAYQGGQLGLGQQQINASLLNEQRQAMGNLAYAGLLNGQTPSQDWINFLMSNQGQNTGGLYNPTSSYGGYTPPTQPPSNGYTPPPAAGGSGGYAGYGGPPSSNVGQSLGYGGYGGYNPANFTFSPQQQQQQQQTNAPLVIQPGQTTAQAMAAAGTPYKAAQTPFTPEQIAMLQGTNFYHPDGQAAYQIAQNYPLSQMDSGLGYSTPYDPKQTSATGVSHITSGFDQTSGQVFNPKTGRWEDPSVSGGSDLNAYLKAMGYDTSSPAAPASTPPATHPATPTPTPAATPAAPPSPTPSSSTSGNTSGNAPATPGQTLPANYQQSAAFRNWTQNGGDPSDTAGFYQFYSGGD